MVERLYSGIREFPRDINVLKTQLRNIVNSIGIIEDYVDVEHTFTAADTEEDISHYWGRIPNRFMIIYQDKEAVVWDSGTAWTTTVAKMKSSAAAATFIIRFFMK